MSISLSVISSKKQPKKYPDGRHRFGIGSASKSSAPTIRRNAASTHETCVVRPRVLLVIAAQPYSEVPRGDEQ
jgi:hypothetical protein